MPDLFAQVRAGIPTVPGTLNVDVRDGALAALQSLEEQLETTHDMLRRVIDALRARHTVRDSALAGMLETALTSNPASERASS